MKKVNFHTHTYRCGHAIGTEKQMIEAAIKIGISELGFSEHIPLPHYRLHLLKGLHVHRSLRSIKTMIVAFKKNGPEMRLPYKDMDKHLLLLDKYKEEYKDKITIYKGFEAEGFEDYFSYYQQLLDNKKIDYLILGHHFHKYSIHDDYIGKKNCTKEDIRIYVADVIKALETQMFSYLAHPDLFLLSYKSFDEEARFMSELLCVEAKRLNIPLELNVGGFRKKKIVMNGKEVHPYANQFFWEIAGKIGNDVIIGFDAHHPDDFNNKIYKEVYELIKECNLNIIDKFEFLKGKKHIK